MVKWLCTLCLSIMLGSLYIQPSVAQFDPRSRTESVCSIGMVEGNTGKSCEVPIPNGCTVANYPGFDEPWAEADKGGRITCEFDKKRTDWKTRITGICGTCQSKQCSVRFTVKFNCSGILPPASQQNLQSR